MTIPAGLPAHFALGLNNKSTGTTDLSWMTGSGVPWDYRFIYSSATDHSNGVYVSDGLMNGYIPIITYYTNPTPRSNLTNTSFMNTYYTNYVSALKSMAGWAGWYLQKSGSAQCTIAADGSSVSYTGTSGTADPVLAGNFHGSGKWIVRFHVNALGTAGAMDVGIGTRAALVNLYLGQSTQSVIIKGNGTGVLLNDSIISATPAITIHQGDDIDLEVDLTAKTIAVSQNGGAFSSTASISGLSFPNTFAPGVNLVNNGDQATFGTPPVVSGWSAWNSSPASTPMIMHIEPDLFGFMQQQMGPSSTQTDDPTQVAISVASSGYTGLGSLPNTAVGFAKALKQLRDTNAPGVYLAWHCSTWAPNDSFVATNASFSETPATTGQRVANFYNGLNTSFDLIFHDTTTGDRDADYGILVNSSGLAATAAVWWWTSTAFTNYLQLLTAFHNQITSATWGYLWQMPIGNTLYKSCNDTTNHYQDNKAEYFLTNSPTAQGSIYNSSAIANFAAAGIAGILFGEGQSGTTSNYDYAGDGTTNPSAITNQNGWSGNTATALFSDDDGGFLRLAAGVYFTSPVSLPSGQVPFLMAQICT
jgi:hypothetical protein